MKKSLIACTALLANLVTTADAGNFYVGPSIFAQQISTNNSTYRDLYPRLAVGYSGMPDNIYLAGEIFYIPTTISSSDTHNNGASSIKTTNSYGISFIPGTLLSTNVLGYLRVGVISTKFSKLNTYKTGAQIGAGLQTNLYGNWDGRIEYMYTAYHSIRGTGTPQSNELGLSAIYKFDSY